MCPWEHVVKITNDGRRHCFEECQSCKDIDFCSHHDNGFEECDCPLPAAKSDQH
jgi:hypothetical protein